LRYDNVGRADPLQVRQRMEHEVIRMTFNLYGHTFDDRGDSWLPLWTAGILHA
jgi:hypothetical protein